jgi:hypothetical protein
VKTCIKGVVNSILGFVETMANGIVSAVNLIIRALNKLSINVPSWVPGIGGKSFGFHITELSKVSIPRLAQGAVIPPNREFMAMLGDQTSGNNIEAPEALLRKIVQEESGSSEMISLLQGILTATKAGHVMKVDKKVLARTAADGINDLTTMTGKSVLLI